MTTCSAPASGSSGTNANHCRGYPLQHHGRQPHGLCRFHDLHWDYKHSQMGPLVPKFTPVPWELGLSGNLVATPQGPHPNVPRRGLQQRSQRATALAPSAVRPLSDRAGSGPKSQRVPRPSHSTNSGGSYLHSFGLTRDPTHMQPNDLEHVGQHQQDVTTVPVVPSSQTTAMFPRGNAT